MSLDYLDLAQVTQRKRGQAVLQERLSFPGALVEDMWTVGFLIILTMVSGVVNCPKPMNLSKTNQVFGGAKTMALMRIVLQIMLQLAAAVLALTAIANRAGAII